MVKIEIGPSDDGGIRATLAGKIDEKFDGHRDPGQRRKPGQRVTLAPRRRALHLVARRARARELHGGSSATATSCSRTSRRRVANQVTMIPNLLGRATVTSAKLPFVCPSCGTEEAAQHPVCHRTPPPRTRRPAARAAPRWTSTASPKNTYRTSECGYQLLVSLETKSESYDSRPSARARSRGATTLSYATGAGRPTELRRAPATRELLLDDFAHRDVLFVAVPTEIVVGGATNRDRTTGLFRSHERLPEVESRRNLILCDPIVKRKLCYGFMPSSCIKKAYESADCSTACFTRSAPPWPACFSMRRSTGRPFLRRAALRPLQRRRELARVHRIDAVVGSAESRAPPDTRARRRPR